jgi:polyphosphate kinase
MRANGCYQFRVTRDSDLFVDEEEVEDLLRALQGELGSRHYGESVRLEVVDDCPEHLIQYLLEECKLTRKDLYLVNGPVNLGRLMAIYDIDRPDLKYPSFLPGLAKQFSREKDFFAVIRQQDVLLHHPYQSFMPIVDFLRQAAADPYVLAIKQTLYRTGANSLIVDALVKAAKAGKEVTVVVELRARFEEEANIGLASKLQEVGAHVVYGVVGYKAHAKMLLVVRREDKQLHRYVHLSTGNYHHKTAALYVDYGLFTSDKGIGEDVHKIFLQLTSLSKVAKLHKILQAPFSLHSALLKKIEREAENARQQKPASIFIKVNSLVEEKIINALYDASQAGVTIKLVVRGMCSLRPGVSGLSENIEVISILGRFLEHSRVFHFYNEGKDEVYLSSADCMERNLLHRVEVAFPIESKALRERVIREMSYYFKDNQRAWRLNSDGSYEKPNAAQGKGFCAQKTFLEELASS